MLCITPLPTLLNDAKEYPFSLVSVRSEDQFNSIIYEEQDSSAEPQAVGRY